MPNKNSIDLICLDSLSDDYENISSVLSEIEGAVGRPIPEHELASQFKALAERSLVDVFRNDKATRKFIKIKISGCTPFPVQRLTRFTGPG